MQQFVEIAVDYVSQYKEQRAHGAYCNDLCLSVGLIVYRCVSRMGAHMGKHLPTWTPTRKKYGDKYPSARVCVHFKEGGVVFLVALQCFSLSLEACGIMTHMHGRTAWI